MNKKLPIFNAPAPLWWESRIITDQRPFSSPSPRQVTLASLSCWLFEGKEFYGTEVKPSNKKNLLFNNGAEQRQLPAHRAGTVPHWFPMDNPAFVYPKHLNSDGPVHECSKHVLLSASHWPRFAPMVFSLFLVRAALYAPNSWILEGKEKTQNNQERTWFVTSWILENTRLQILSVTCRNKQKKGKSENPVCNVSVPSLMASTVFLAP